ncbi:MAG: Rieske 2Fe-2S domain-containing protein [Actinobacteria bacterium]|nr:Rieske 2Fe-2S domain-containing protein [Actinomycetota bacterium]
MSETTDRLGLPDPVAFVRQGDPSREICAVAEREGHDLVVVGNRGMAGARRYVLDSVPNRVSHRARCDVLIAKTVGRSIEELGPGEGGVVLAAGRRVAAYRGEDGSLHALSSRCTHMGCTVGWNDAERTWDCPCHGSKYDRDGHVVRGPAEKDLSPVALDEA